MNDRDRLLDGVTEGVTVTGSVARLLRNVAAHLRAASGNRTAVEAFSDLLESGAPHIADHVMANVPVVMGVHPEPSAAREAMADHYADRIAGMEDSLRDASDHITALAERIRELEAEKADAPADGAQANTKQAASDGAGDGAPGQRGTATV